jgi:hypothetical protein
MGLALHVILRLDQEDCILGRGLTIALSFASIIQECSWSAAHTLLILLF